jgi:para-nitrobenzyl esterase
MFMQISRRTFFDLGAAAAGSMFFSGSAARALAQTSAGKSSSSPIVDTTTGKLRGTLVDRVNVFNAVPYGASTAGTRRFLAPTTPQPWTGVRDAIELGQMCPQGPDLMFERFPGLERRQDAGEDCLWVNVWTAGLGAARKRPVMIWLHGGGFASGSAGFRTYDGANLARKHDVVVVGVNHRLNTFGFLYLADTGGEKYAASANAGMQDIVLALEWVRDNIEKFGGDPKSVTIFGQSAGGVKGGTLMGMPSAKGLFHRLIAASGAALTSGSKQSARTAAEALLMRAGVSADAAGIDQLQKLPAEQLMKLAAAGRGSPGGPVGNGPVIDGRILPADLFTPGAPAFSREMPMITGSVETEFTFIMPPREDDLSDEQLRARVKQTLGKDSSDEAADRVIAAYKKSRPAASNGDIAAIVGSLFIVAGPDTQAERKAAQGGGKVFKYYFQKYSPVQGGRLRAFHTADIPYMFDNVDDLKEMTGGGPAAQSLASKISNAWVAFAHTGDPNHPGLPSWAPFTVERQTTMIFNDECKAVDRPFAEERAAVTAARAPRQASTKGSTDLLGIWV